MAAVSLLLQLELSEHHLLHQRLNLLCTIERARLPEAFKQNLNAKTAIDSQILQKKTVCNSETVKHMLCRLVVNSAVVHLAVRFGLRGQVSIGTRDLVFGGSVMGALAHAGYVMGRDTTM